MLLLASSYLEWGTGGSTVVAAWLAVQKSTSLLRIDTIDSSAEWATRLQDRNPILAQAQQAGRLSFHLANMGKTKEWGYPRDWASRPLALRYAQARSYVEQLGAVRCCVDMVFVDGRFRVASVLHALRVAHPHSVGKLNSTTLARPSA